MFCWALPPSPATTSLSRNRTSASFKLARDASVPQDRSLSPVPRAASSTRTNDCSGRVCRPRRHPATKYWYYAVEVCRGLARPTLAQSMKGMRRNASALRRTTPSSVLWCSSSQVRGKRIQKHWGALRKARRVMHLRLPRCGVTSVEWGPSGVRRIVRAAGDAKDHERVVFTFVPTY